MTAKNTISSVESMHAMALASAVIDEVNSALFIYLCSSCVSFSYSICEIRKAGTGRVYPFVFGRCQAGYRLRYHSPVGGAFRKAIFRRDRSEKDFRP